MDGRQYFPNYGGNYQQTPEFNATGYGRGFGVPGSYFMPGSNPGTKLVDLLHSAKSYANVCRFMPVFAHLFTVQWHHSKSVDRSVELVCIQTMASRTRIQLYS